MEYYCLKCKKRTPNAFPPTLKHTRNNRVIGLTECDICKKKKSFFVKGQENQKKNKTGKGVLNTIINALPFELHLPGYQYCGPGTKLEKRLARGEPGINKLDKACKTHDIAYSQYIDLEHRHAADKILSEEANKVKNESDRNWKEKLAAATVKKAMDAKVKLGLGIDQKNI